MPRATPFVSPLWIAAPDAFTAIDFGAVSLGPDLARLRATLGDCLQRTAARLPPAWLPEAQRVLAGYSGGRGDFFRLFYVPTWSFLHWVPASAGRPLPSDGLSLAHRAHALALFLHLWDDHLCDGQLVTDLLRLQLRTLAWEACTAAGRGLAHALGADPSRFEALAAEYLVSAHARGVVCDLDAYIRRFRSQVALWTAVPAWLGAAVAGPAAGTALATAVEEFAVAWRLLDDIQDIHLDSRAGRESAVWYMLDPARRALWAACAAEVEPDGAAWPALVASIQSSGCLPSLLTAVGAHLRRAACLTATHGWSALSAELAQCAQGCVPPLVAD